MVNVTVVSQHYLSRLSITKHFLDVVNPNAYETDPCVNTFMRQALYNVLVLRLVLSPSVINELVCADTAHITHVPQNSNGKE